MRRLLHQPTDAELAWLPVLALPPLLVSDVLLYGEDPVTVTGVLAVVVACLPLRWRGQLSFWQMLPLVVGGVMLCLWQLKPHSTVQLIPMVALYAIVKRGSRRQTVWIAASLAPAVVISIVPFAASAREVVQIAVPNFVLCLLGIVAGEATRMREEAVRREGEARAELARRHASEQRLHIAQEVHDTVAHAMVAINVQAGVAAHLLERDPSHAHAALREIKATSGEALAQLRATLGVLRDPDSGAPLGVGGDEFRLDAVDELAAPLRAGGIDVRVDVDDAALAGLPPALHATGYRIVQEALTNVLRHAHGPQVAAVSVRRENGALAIAVRDDGEAAALRAGGHGVRGMRERAAAHGGSLEAGPAAGGGWRVDATLPIA